MPDADRHLHCTSWAYLQAMRPMLMELCLSLPGGLQSLLPLLPKLMRVLSLALRNHTSEEVLHKALHTLETWVDSLNPEFLEPAMADVLHELMPALWALVKPTSQLKSTSHMAVMLLGKLGAGLSL
jgi:transformation/transcription domain-associated protein